MDLEPPGKAIGWLWKHRHRDGVQGGTDRVEASVGLDNSRNSAEMFNLPKTAERRTAAQ